MNMIYPILFEYDVSYFVFLQAIYTADCKILLANGTSFQLEGD